MAEDQQVYRRAAAAALVGLVVQFVLALAMTLVYFWSESPALRAAVFHLYGGLPVWGVLLLLFHQHRIEREEALEVEQLSRADTQTATIFQEHAEDLQLARRRLWSIQKWGLGAVSLLVSAYLLAAGLTLAARSFTSVTVVTVVRTVKSTEPDAPTQQVPELVPITARQLAQYAMRQDASAMALMFLCFAGAFVAFVVARYVAGMTKVSHWQQLRGGAGYLMGNALVLALIGIGALVGLWNQLALLAYLSVLVGAIMALIGLEILVTFLLSAYRPRKPGEVPRPAFDSRVLGLLTSPESIARTISETINYQFGFEVSRSWFYQLLGRAITPLCIVGLVVLALISSVVVVPAQQRALVTTFGSLWRVAEPGISLKWPWPIGRVMMLNVGQVHEITFGSAQGGLAHDKPILWTNPHGTGAEDFFTVPQAAPLTRSDTPEDTSARTPGVSLLGVQVVVQYAIGDPVAYALCAVDPDKLLLSLAEAQVNAYFLTHNIDLLLGAGRIVAGDELRSRIDAAAKDAGMGIDVVFVGLQGVHPPQNEQVAEAFLKQIGALQDMQSAIEDARKRRTEILSAVAGSEARAQEIDQAIRRLDGLRTATAPEAAAITEQQAKIEALLAQAGGEASQALFDAMAFRWRTSVSAKARADLFAAQVAASRHAPELFRTQVYYQTLAEGLAEARKYVIDPRSADASVFRIDLKDTRSQLDLFTTQR